MEIIERESWVNPSRGYRLSRVTWPGNPTSYVHHSAGPAPASRSTLAQDLGVVRAIDNFHFYTRGWRGGVGYGYLILPSGRIVEGRGEHMGAHAVGANHLPGVCMVGTFATADPTAQALDSLAWLLRDFLHAGIVHGHRDINPTSCPGDDLYDLLGGIFGRPVGPEAPDGNTLRLHWVDARGVKHVAADWVQVGNAMQWFQVNGFHGHSIAIAWRGAEPWRGWEDVLNVWLTLENRFL